MHGYRQHDHVVVGLTPTPEYATSWGDVKGLGGVDNTQLSAYCQVTLLACLGVVVIRTPRNTADNSFLQLLIILILESTKFRVRNNSDAAEMLTSKSCTACDMFWRRSHQHDCSPTHITQQIYNCYNEPHLQQLHGPGLCVKRCPQQGSKTAREANAWDQQMLRCRIRPALAVAARGCRVQKTFVLWHGLPEAAARPRSLRVMMPTT